MKYILIILFTLLCFSSKSQVMKPIRDGIADFNISIVTDSTKADMVIFLTKIRYDARRKPCYWRITLGNRYDFTYKVVSENPDFSIYITKCPECVNIRNEFLRCGLKNYKLTR